jgi:hypothetical protein
VDFAAYISFSFTNHVMFHTSILHKSLLSRIIINDRVNTVSVRSGAAVEALRYKLEGRGFDPRWCH